MGFLMRRTTILLACCLLLTTRPMTGQPPPPASNTDQQPPVRFKVEVNYVEIDATVLDASGNFVRDLAKDDFQVFEDGKPQPVTVFSLVDIPVERAEPALVPSPIEPDVRSNTREFDGRVFVLVLDDLNTHVARSAQVKLAAKLFIERYLGANDIAAVVYTGGSRSAQEFTGSRPRLLRSVESFMGQKLRSATLEKIDDYFRQRDLRSGNAPRDALEAERAYRARAALETLESVANYMTGIRGRRKSVVFFSEGIDYDISNAIQNTYATDVLGETQDAIAAATRANVSFYGIDPRGLGGLVDETMDLQSLPEDNSLGVTTLQNELRLSQDSLRVISNETGGFAAVNRNDFNDAFARIIRENSSYYVLGYYSDTAKRDGRFRRVDVRVTRPGVQVRARKGYVPPRSRPAPDTTAGNKSISAALREAVDSPIPVSGLGLTVFAAPLKGSAPNASVLLALELDGSVLHFTPKNGMFADDLEVAVVAVGADGKPRDGGRDMIELRLRPQTHEMLTRSGVRVMRRLDVPPGRYQLRVGARDTGSGRLGSVTLDLDVPDFSKPDLAMSGLILTSAAASHTPTANPDPEFKGVLPASPAALREFPRGDAVTVFAEVYDNRPSPPHRVEIKTSVLNEAGTVVFSAADERKTDELQGKRGGYGYTATIPLQSMAPGRYVLRVEAQVLLSNGGRAARDVEFRVR